MTAVRYLGILWVILATGLSVIAQDEPRMSLEERVNQAKLIVVGKLHVLPGGKHGACTVEISQTLFGAMPTNQALEVRYNSSSWLVPEIASRSYTMKRGRSQICFVTDQGVAQRFGAATPDTYLTRAVGTNGSCYAHDGFELATDEALKKVQGLIARREQKK